MSIDNDRYRRECEAIYEAMIAKYNDLVVLQQRLASTGIRGRDDKDKSISQMADNTKESANKIDKILDILKEELVSYRKKLDGKGDITASPSSQPVVKTTSVPTANSPPSYQQQHQHQHHSPPSAPPAPNPPPTPSLNQRPTYPPPQQQGYLPPSSVQTHQQSHTPPSQQPVYIYKNPPQPAPAKPAVVVFQTGAFQGNQKTNTSHAPIYRSDITQQQHNQQKSVHTGNTSNHHNPTKPQKPKKHSKSSSSSSSTGELKKFEHSVSVTATRLFGSDKKDKKDKKH